MRIGFDASVIFSSVGGTRTYALQLLSALISKRSGWEYFLYARSEAQAAQLRERWAASNVNPIVVAGSPNTLRVQRALPPVLRRDRIDVYHSLGYFLPLRWAGPKIVTIHDMNVYASWRQWLRPKKILNWADMALQVPLAARAARAIITDSTASRDLIQRFLHVGDGRIVVIPLAPDPFFDGVPSTAEEDEAVTVARGNRFVLFVGIISAQKNLGMLVRAFADSGIAARGVNLVLAGSDREGEGAALLRLAAASGVAEHVVLAGYVSLPALRALYHLALATVLPSHGEGFGLPLVEAMAGGSPVLAARRQSLPEVVGDGGELFEPDDRPALAEMLRRVEHDEEFRRDLAARARRRRAAFSWEAAAEATAQVYEDALSSSR